MMTSCGRPGAGVGVGLGDAFGVALGEGEGAGVGDAVGLALGVAVGLGLGLGFGYLFARSLVDDGLDITVVPWDQALLFLVVAAVVGVLAALWPGHRAARTRPLEAIAAE